MPEVTFLHAGFLSAAAVAAGLPILVHLLLRQRARTVDIGSVRFLRDVILEHTRRRRIRKWFLLALRILVVLLLGLLFARPVLDRSRLLGSSREVVLMIDSSASMGTSASQGTTVFDRAREEAGEVLKRLAENTAVRVAFFDTGGVHEIQPDQLPQRSSPGDGATDYTAALQWCRDILIHSSRPNRVVHLWSDLQRSGLRGRVQSFPDEIAVVVHDVGRDMLQNVAIEKAEAINIEIRPGKPVTVACGLRNGSVLPVQSHVALRIEGPSGPLAATETVDLSGGKRITLTFPLAISIPGVYRGEFLVDYDDDLASDNRRFVAFQVRLPDRLLLVDGQLGNSVYTNETYFLEMTLRLDVPFPDHPSRTYEVERIDWEDGEGFPDLTGFRVVVLANVASIRDLDLRRLRDYVAAGGRLLVFAGDRITPTTISAMHEVGIAPGEIMLTPRTGRLRISSWAEEHPIFQPFSDPQHGDLRRLAFRRMLRWETVDESHPVLMKAGEEPFMIEQPLGKGRVVFIGTTADRQWSDWPQNRLYVPLIRQTMAYLTDQLTEQQSVHTATVSRVEEKAGIEMVDGGTRVLNVDPRESLLERMTCEGFRDGLGLPQGRDGESMTVDSSQLSGSAQRPGEAWTAAVWLLLAVLGAELLLASRIHA